MNSTPYVDFTNKLEAIVERILDGYEPRKVTDDKIIRDAVWGFNVFQKHEINIIDSPLLQRLRRIHQTALAVLTYPSSTHTRFEHSLGCVVIADKMMRAINDKHRTEQVTSVQRAETRLAALLHDCGHGPFSHASEAVYGDAPFEIAALKTAEKDLFGAASPHEIVGYCIVKSRAFRALWGRIVSLYNVQSDRLSCDLNGISLDRVASMILGRKAADDYRKYISQIVNGPFDADKFDYIIRDGYFTGLVTAIDVERLFVSLDWVPFSEHSNPSHAEDNLCMDLGGATVLEQVLFNKMMLFSSFYHHHKVRASYRLIESIFESLIKEKFALGDVVLDQAPNFLLLDDGAILSSTPTNSWPDMAKKGVTALRERRLPKRALVVTKDAFSDAHSRAEYFMLRDDKQLRTSQEEEISKNAGNISPVFVDCPDEPGFAVSGLHSLVRLRPGQYVTLDELYPASGWVSGYSEYRYRSYVFSPEGSEVAVNAAALNVFRDRGIQLDAALCTALTKLRRPA